MGVSILIGDCRAKLQTLEAQSVHTCVTSPPYFGLRDYGHAGQIGLEDTPDAFVAEMVAVFREVRRVLRDDGTLWLNLGDSYTTGASVSDRKSDPKAVGDVSKGMRRVGTPEGLKAKDLIGIPWRVAFALQAAGWYLRQDIIWHKPNPMPESVTDRCTKAHEYLFLLTKSERYFWDADAMQEQAVYAGVTGMDGSGFKPPQDFAGKHAGGSETLPPRKRVTGEHDGTRNRRSVWTVPTQPYAGAHFATFPPALIEPCVLAGSRPGDVVLDPFMGSGTTAQVAQALGRQWIGCELNTEYAPLQQARTAQVALAI